MISDLYATVLFIEEFTSSIWNGAIGAATQAWTLNDRIPYPVVDVIIPGFLAILGVCIILIVIPGFVILFIYSGIQYYTKYNSNGKSTLVALIPLAIIIWFADDLSFIPINLVLLYLMIQAVYIIIRFYNSPDNENC